jgi:mannose-6-phosphate isomerase-like protein (cupin superfamily)
MKNYNVIQQALQGVFPNCPENFALNFLALLEVPIEELATQSIFTLEKPYGRNHILIDQGDFGLSCAWLLPGRSTSLHYHNTRQEFFCVRVGKVTLTSGTSVCHLNSLEYGKSIPGIPHALANSDIQPAEVLEVFAPAILDDKCRISDPYARRIGKVGVSE